jgi:endogenous inhibitor of DNA gyrase (YacG/DUF329 family)
MEVKTQRSDDGRTAVAVTCPKCGESVGWILTDGVPRECQCPRCAKRVLSFDGTTLSVPPT